MAKQKLSICPTLPQCDLLPCSHIILYFSCQLTHYSIPAVLKLSNISQTAEIAAYIIVNNQCQVNIQVAWDVYATCDQCCAWNRSYLLWKKLFCLICAMYLAQNP